MGEGGGRGRGRGAGFGAGRTGGGGGDGGEKALNTRHKQFLPQIVMEIHCESAEP